MGHPSTRRAGLHADGQPKRGLVARVERGDQPPRASAGVLIGEDAVISTRVGDTLGAKRAGPRLGWPSYAGLRLGEMLALDWSAIDVECGHAPGGALVGTTARCDAGI